jgi:hypothetical protein
VSEYCSGVAGDGERVDFVGLEEGGKGETGESRKIPGRESPLIGCNVGFFLFHAREVLHVVVMADYRVIFFIYGH